MNTILKNIIALALIPQFLLVKWLQTHPFVIEKYYSTGLYILISKINRLLFGWIPFSVGDILYLLSFIALFRFLYIKGKLLWSTPFIFLREIVMSFSIIYFLFHILWGFNYYRVPLQEKLNIDNNYTDKALLLFTERLIIRSNHLHSQLTNNDTVLVHIPYSKNEVYKKATDSYENIFLKLPKEQYKPKSIKTSLFSIPLSYMGYNGYFNPFTNEAQVNGVQMNFNFPIISCHEIAHQMGYSAENEANFIAFMAAKNNKDLYFKYAAYLYVLRYCLNEVARTNTEMYNYYKKQLTKGILKNYEELQLFWAKYETPVEPIFKRTFDSFLKANNQSDGIKSYSYVVAMLINYDKKYGLL